MIDLSIIIVSYNTRDITKKCLDTIQASLRKAQFSTEIIVFDNASTDGSVAMLKSQKQFLSIPSHLFFTLIESNENLGFGVGNNRAIEKAHGKVLLLLNTDIEVIDNAIPQLYEYFTSKKNPFTILGAKLLEKNLHAQPSCGPAYNLWNIFLFLFLQGDRFHITRYSPKTIQEVDWVSGSCFMMLKSVFDKLGRFDENIFMYMEEIDLFHRAKLQNMTIGFYPYALFIHLGSKSSQKRTQPILQVYKGYLYFYKKHFSEREMHFLKVLLQLKAYSAYALGKCIGNNYLITTYEQALEIIKGY